LNKYNPKIPLGAGIAAGFLLMGSTALIDTGYMFELAHDICATSFFILTFFAQVYNVVVVADLQKRTQAFSQNNLYVKYIICGILAIQLVGNFGMGFDLPGYARTNDNKGNFYEWTLTVTIISMFLSIGTDASRFDFVYSEAPPEHQLPPA
jgi:hypothetical protein